MSAPELEKLEKLAAQQAEMPDGLDGAEQLMFLSLRYLYALFHSGKIKKDMARIEKTKILKEYANNVLLLKCWNQARQREQEMSVLLPEMKDSGCEVCRKFFKIHTGMKHEM